MDTSGNVWKADSDWIMAISCTSQAAQSTKYVLDNIT